MRDVRTGEGAGERYEVRCATCGASFDVLTARWCRCLVKERSLVCPRCSSCFCKAPRAYREKLWIEAPQALWDRKLAEHRRAFAVPANGPVGEVPRPLVLIVDDEEGILRLAREAVLELGYGVIVARDGAEGLALAAAHRPDLVLTDALMPKLDGRELCRRIKAEPATAGVKTVVMTSVYKGALQRFEAMRAFQVDEYLPKPLDEKTLGAVLHRLVGGRRGG